MLTGSQDIYTGPHTVLMLPRYGKCPHDHTQIIPGHTYYLDIVTGSQDMLTVSQDMLTFFPDRLLRHFYIVL
jgi:hypothetical protein